MADDKRCEYVPKKAHDFFPVGDKNVIFLGNGDKKDIRLDCKPPPDGRDPFDWAMEALRNPGDPYYWEESNVG